MGGIKVQDAWPGTATSSISWSGRRTLKQGDTIRRTIDREKRYRKMRLHSASHIVVHIIREVFGDRCAIASSGLLDEAKERSDYLFDGPLDKAKLAEVERRANALIAGDKGLQGPYRSGEPPPGAGWPGQCGAAARIRKIQKRSEP